MRTVRFLFLLLLGSYAIAGVAADKALVTSMKKVKCGAPVARFSVMEALVGTNPVTPDLSCLEFTLRTPRVQYRLRPSRQMLLPVGSTVNLRVDKKHVLVQVEDAKEVRCEVVSMDLLDDNGTPVEPRDPDGFVLPSMAQAFMKAHAPSGAMPQSATRNCLNLEGDVVPCGNSSAETR